MKNLTPILKTILMSAVIASAINAQAESSSSTENKNASATANSNISVRNQNGKSVVTLNGKVIYTGELKGPATSRSSNVNGVEYSAAFDGDKVLWENVPGAAQQVQSGVGSVGGSEQNKQFIAEHQKNVDQMMKEQREFLKANGGTQAETTPSPSPSGNKPISTKTVNGSTVVVYQGQEIAVGPTEGTVTAKSKNINGKDYAAAFDGDRVIWENVPGAAQKLK